MFAATAQLVTKWEQKSLTLAVTGDARIVRLWDAETELKKQDIPTGADCCTTCIDVDGTGCLKESHFYLLIHYYFIYITYIRTLFLFTVCKIINVMSIFKF